ncbi:MAG: hypothetical protein IPH45_21700 [Bacteroidales bacterium]|nr:hypothetical protein [Bacteroidales bacterium]
MQAGPLDLSTQNGGQWLSLPFSPGNGSCSLDFVHDGVELKVDQLQPAMLDPDSQI